MFNLKSLVFIGLFLICTILHANNRPEWFIPPPLDPTGVELETLEIDEGVFALLSNTPFADNTGFVVGENSVLVIDAHFTGEMGEQIIAAVKKGCVLGFQFHHERGGEVGLNLLLESILELCRNKISWVNIYEPDNFI